MSDADVNGDVDVLDKVQDLMERSSNGQRWPWKSFETMCEIEADLEVALSTLTDKQKKFVIHYAANFDGAAASKHAGYTTNRLASLRENRDFNLVMNLLERHRQLKFGIDVAWKRLQLVEMQAEAREDGSYGAAVSSLRLLAEMDGDIKTPAGQAGNAQVTIKVNTGIDREPVTIEQEPEEPEFQGFL